MSGHARQARARRGRERFFADGEALAAAAFHERVAFDDRDVVIVDERVYLTESWTSFARARPSIG